MAAVKEITPVYSEEEKNLLAQNCPWCLIRYCSNNPLRACTQDGDCAGGTCSTERTYLFQSTGFTFNNYKEGDWAQGKLWVTEHQTNRILLLDENGGIVKVIGAIDKFHLGGDRAYQGCQNIYDPNNFYLWWPGGSMGFDTGNNIYLSDEKFHRVSRYQLPYEPITLNNRTCLPEPNGGLFKSERPLTPNLWSAEKLGESVGLTTVDGVVDGQTYSQLIAQDEGRLKVWDDYRQKGFGAPADITLPTTNTSRSLLSAAVDEANRLWYVGEHHLLYVYQLPLQAGSTPLKSGVTLSWQDTGERIYYYASGVAFDKINRKLYLVDGPRNRILRISNYSDFNNGLQVDMVIGQNNKTDSACNHGSSTPVPDGLCAPYQIKFDNGGNLFVIENNYECHGNNRISVFLAQDLAAATGMFPGLSAKKVFVAPTLFEKGPCAYGVVGQPGSPVSLAFNSRNEMVVGNDGYYGLASERHLRQLWLYKDPLNKQTPDEFIELPMGAPGEMAFDTEDNLFIQDHTWSRVWGINLDLDWFPRADAADMRQLLEQWGPAGQGLASRSSDMNEDGAVNGVDYEWLRKSWVDPISQTLACDLNGDGKESKEDGDLVVSCWNKPAQGSCQSFDADGDGVITITDIQYFSSRCPHIF
jgi:sugar lactone lactonase YvrE